MSFDSDFYFYGTFLKSFHFNAMNSSIYILIGFGNPDSVKWKYNKRCIEKYW